MVARLPEGTLVKLQKAWLSAEAVSKPAAIGSLPCNVIELFKPVLHKV